MEGTVKATAAGRLFQRPHQGGVPARVSVTWDVEDPHAVWVVVSAGTIDRVLVIDRDALNEALDSATPVGEGDIRACSVGPWTSIVIRDRWNTHIVAPRDIIDFVLEEAAKAATPDWLDAAVEADLDNALDAILEAGA